MVLDEIFSHAKSGKVVVYFDMDGTCAEYQVAKNAIMKNEQGFFLTRRPLKSVIKIMKKLSKNKNITVKIISFCWFNEQKQDKLLWLETFVPFVKKEDVNIIVLSEESFTKQTKYALKCNNIKKEMQKGVVYYLFEDDVRVINASVEVLPELNINHISTLIR